MQMIELIRAYGREMYEAGIRENEPTGEKRLESAEDILATIQELLKNKPYLENQLKYMDFSV